MRPFSSGCIPFHCTRMLKATTRYAKCASKPSQVWCRIFLLPQTRSQHNEGDFHRHAHVPFPSTADLDVGRVAFGAMKASVSQDNHLTVVVGEQRQEGLVFTLAVAQSQSVIKPHWFCTTQSLPPRIQRWLEMPFFPI